MIETVLDNIIQCVGIKNARNRRLLSVIRSICCRFFLPLEKHTVYTLLLHICTKTPNTQFRSAKSNAQPASSEGPFPAF